MLKGIDPALSPDLLKLLAEMGHDDTVVLADANFTAHRLAQGKPVLQLPALGMERVLQAVLSIFPLADDVAHPVEFMQVGGQPAEYRSGLQRDVLALLGRHGVRAERAQAVERFAFYEHAKMAYAIVLTGELQPWGNVILHKGVVGEALRP